MPTATSQVVSQLQRSIARAIYGKEEAIQLALITLLARGHLLIEDVPGVGKTTLAQALAKSFHCSFQRIQFTSDLLPSHVLGVSVYNPENIAAFSASSLLRTCFPVMFSASASTIPSRANLNFAPAPFSQTSSSPTKSIAPRRARNPLFSKP